MLDRNPVDSFAYISHTTSIAVSKSRIARRYAKTAATELEGENLAEWRTPQGGGLIAAGTRVFAAMDPHGAMRRYVGFNTGSTGETGAARRIAPKS